jgi:hypothetical protein
MTQGRAVHASSCHKQEGECGWGVTQPIHWHNFCLCAQSVPNRGANRLWIQQLHGKRGSHAARITIWVAFASKFHTASTIIFLHDEALQSFASSSDRSVSLLFYCHFRSREVADVPGRSAAVFWWRAESFPSTKWMLGSKWCTNLRTVY